MRTRCGRGHAGTVDAIRASARAGGLKGPNVEGNYSVNCPFCPARRGREDNEKKLTFKVTGQVRATADRPAVALSPRRGAWNRYRCGARGFADFTWIADLGEDVEVGEDAALPPPELGAPDGFLPLDEAHPDFAAYLQGRGVLAAARAVGAGGVERWTYRRQDGTPFTVAERRVVVPHLRDLRGPWVGYSARLVRGRERAPKYMYPDRMDRRAGLWGLPWLPSDDAAVWVVEGVFDALPLFPRAVATFGKAVTDEQLEQLAEIGRTRTVVACLDGDAWADARALAARLALRGARAAWCHLPPGTDPGTLGWGVTKHVVTGQ